MPPQRKVPRRMCVGCGTTGAKRGLIRIVRTPEGQVVVDPTGKRNGRGAYVCNETCLDRALKGRLEKALNRAVSPEEARVLRHAVAAIAGGRGPAGDTPEGIAGHG